VGRVRARPALLGSQKPERHKENIMSDLTPETSETWQTLLEAVRETE
jgi:hypothetical protein